jgi:putative ABC transport system permease protein
MGSDLLVVRAGKFIQHRGHSHQRGSVDSLKPEDARAIERKIPGVVIAAAAIQKSMSVKFNVFATQTTVEALETAGMVVRDVEAERGRLFTDQEQGARRTVAVLGATVAENLFPGGDAVGANVTIGRLPFRVVGVARSKGADMNGNDQDDIVYIPLDTGMKRLFHMTHVLSIYVRAEDENMLGDMAEEIGALMRVRHRVKEGQDDDVTVQNQAAMMEVATETAASTTRLVGGVAGIILMVAGIGILAVMLMSVRERRWEIGLRRALGATRSEILYQFLTEAALLSFAGGLLGIGLGVLGVALTNRYGWARADFSVEAALVASGFSILIGLIFGIYPARKASLLEPITALQSAG